MASPLHHPECPYRPKADSKISGLYHNFSVFFWDISPFFHLSAMMAKLLASKALITMKKKVAQPGYTDLVRYTQCYVPEGIA